MTLGAVFMGAESLTALPARSGRHRTLSIQGCNSYVTLVSVSQCEVKTKWAQTRNISFESLVKMHVRIKIIEVHLELVSLLSLENSSVDTGRYTRALTRLGAVQHLVQTSRV